MHPVDKLVGKEEVCGDVVDPAAGVMQQPFYYQQLSLACEDVGDLNVVFLVEDSLEICLFFGDLLTELIDDLEFVQWHRFPENPLQKLPTPREEVNITKSLAASLHSTSSNFPPFLSRVQRNKITNKQGIAILHLRAIHIKPMLEALFDLAHNKKPKILILEEYGSDHSVDIDRIEELILS